MKTKKLGGQLRKMDPWKRRGEVKDDHDTSRKPSALFWREDSINKPRIETTRKKDTSGLFNIY